VTFLVSNIPRAHTQAVPRLAEAKAQPTALASQRDSRLVVRQLRGGGEVTA